MQEYFPEVSIQPSYTSEELLSKTNIIVAATTSAEPVLPDNENLLKGKHFISIGSYKPSMQEFPDSVYRLSDKLFIDSEFARHETGDCINPVKKQILKDTDVYTIGKLLTKEQSVNVYSTTVYKSAGMALYDLYVAEAMYNQAMQLHVGTEVDF